MSEDFQKLLLCALLGIIAGALVFLGGLYILQRLADWILSLDPVPVGSVGAFIGLVTGIVFYKWIKR